jgi:hypothetical protein
MRHVNETFGPFPEEMQVSGVKWPAVVSWFITVGKIAIQLAKAAGWYVRILYLRTFLYCRRAWQAPSVRKIACDFCAEVAVLITVFPPLEFLIARRQGVAPVDMGAVIRWSATFVLVFLFAAVILADKDAKEK